MIHIIHIIHIIPRRTMILLNKFICKKGKFLNGRSYYYDGNKCWTGKSHVGNYYVVVQWDEAPINRFKISSELGKGKTPFKTCLFMKYDGNLCSRFSIPVCGADSSKYFYLRKWDSYVGAGYAEIFVDDGIYNR